MKVLSLFDGMACGMLAMIEAGIKVERYVAYEIDKYAVQTSAHNFPMIEHRGDVFRADFTEFRGFDFVVGGSPCTYWSIAQKNNRETEASGMGWELFSQYVRAVKEAQPVYFIYENNKSMANAIRESITQTFGFEPICINSALVSAQNRNRLYWVGKRNPDGSYSRVKVEQPEDRGILLRDVLDRAVAWQDKSFCITATEHKGSTPDYTLTKHKRTMVAEPIRIPEYGIKGKARPLGANYPNNCGGFEHRMFSENPNKQQVDMVAQTVPGPSNATEDGSQVCSYSHPHGWNEGIFTYEKFPNLTTGSSIRQQNVLIEGVDDSNIHLTNNPLAFCNKIYEVKDGQITIKEKQYPIKLADGFYIIRKLTANECKRLQTVPEWYEFPVSDTQAYKMLGNGWTVAVIGHLIEATQANELEAEQLDLFKQWGYA